MDAATELSLLETAYTNYLTRGGVASYAVNNRSVTFGDVTKLIARMDQLRAIVYRQQGNGVFNVGQMRTPE